VIASRKAGLTKDRFETDAVELVDWSLDAVIPCLKQADWIAHGWLNLFHSAVVAFNVSPAHLHAILVGA